MRQRGILIALVALGLAVALVALLRPHQARFESGNVAFTGKPAGSSLAQNTAGTPAVSTFGDNDIIAALTQSPEPNLQTGNFNIVSTAQPVSGWYVVVVLPNGGGDNEIIILHASNNALSIVLGPGTTLRIRDMQAAGVPQVVQDAVRAL